MQSPAVTSRPVQSGRERRGFTLLELLVVMGIIAFLAAMLATVWGNYQTRAQETATAATILKINRLLDQRLKSLAEAFGRENLKGALARKEAELGDPSHPFGPVFGLQEAALRALVFKDRVRAAFPQRFEDLYGPDAAPGVAGDDDDGNGTTDFDSAGNPDILELGFAGSDDTAPAITAAIRKLNLTINMHDRATESAELLYIALTQANVFGSAPVDSDAFQGKELADTDGDGLQEFVDAWGEPIRFYRWPTRLIKPGGTLDRSLTNLLILGLPAQPSSDQRDPLEIDPDDPSGAIQAALDDPKKSNFVKHFAETTYHTVDTYHVPLIVSAGSDRVLGLFEPYDDGNFGTLAQPVDVGNTEPLLDNITNRNRRVGGN